MISADCKIGQTYDDYSPTDSGFLGPIPKSIFRNQYFFVFKLVTHTY